MCTSEFEEFDAIGNPTSYGLAYLYWEGRQLTEYYDWEDGFSYTYAYNDAGVRISKTVDGVLHEYVVDGIQIQREVIYYVEWKAHNHTYLFSQHERVAHTDFDKNDEETSYLGYWWRAIKEMLRIC